MYGIGNYTSDLGQLTPARGYSYMLTPGSAGTCGNVETSIQRYLAQMVALSHVLARECGPNAALELQRRFSRL
jgi:hypothetical protein